MATLNVLIKQDSEDLKLVSIIGIFGDLKRKKVFNNLKDTFFKENKSLIKDGLFSDNDINVYLNYLIKNNRVSNGFYYYKLVKVNDKKISL